LRNSSTQGPISQPSSARQTLCSGSLIVEILSTVLFPLIGLSKSKLCANAVGKAGMIYVIE
jgi:hypothetical protein